MKQIKSARKLGAKNPAIVFDVAGTMMPIKDNSFDIVTALAVFHHLPTKSDRIKFLKEIKRVLKPHGQAMITALHAEKGGFSSNKSGFSNTKSGFIGNMSYGGMDREYYFYSKVE